MTMDQGAAVAACSREAGGRRSSGWSRSSYRFRPNIPVGSIVIDTKGRQLFLVQSPTMALRYPISVGREGFSWTGTETISRKAEWPDWHPPVEMR